MPLREIENHNFWFPQIVRIPLNKVLQTFLLGSCLLQAPRSPTCCTLAGRSIHRPVLWPAQETRRKMHQSTCSPRTTMSAETRPESLQGRICSVVTICSVFLQCGAEFSLGECSQLTNSLPARGKAYTPGIDIIDIPSSLMISLPIPTVSSLSSYLKISRPGTPRSSRRPLQKTKPVGNPVVNASLHPDEKQLAVLL